MSTPLPAFVGSTGSTTFVLVTVLVLAGLAMIGLTVWLVRSTRSDAPAVGPLEVMGERRWRRGDGDARAAALTAARPPGASPPAPMVPIDAEDEPTPSLPPPNGEPSTPEPAVSAHTSPETPSEA